jgi:COMPASS component SWD3
MLKGSEDCLIKIWSVERNLLMATLKGHTKQVNCIDINSLNSLLASGSSDKKVLVWDLETTKNLFSLNSHTKSVEVVKVSQNYNLQL